MFRRALNTLLWLPLTFALNLATLADEPEFVWLEGEAGKVAGAKGNVAGWGNKQFLSGETWLQVQVDAEKVEKEVPTNGVTIAYPFTIKADGNFEVWDRVGYEFVRSPFDWRIDNGDWTTAKPDELTTDLMEIEFFNEVAWLKLGDRPLKAGNHTLEIRLTKRKNDKGEPERILYASDAILFHAGKFAPNGRFKPGDDGRDQADKKAETVVFRLPEPKAAMDRTFVDMKGTWEIARDDEQMPGEVAAPIGALPDPAKTFWRAIPVPGDKNTLRPDLVFAHRVWYRTRVEVPMEAEGRSFFLVFPQNNLNTTVYVNGRLCGFDKNPFARVQIDVSKAMKPGINEVLVGIRDAWYGRSADPERPLKLRKTFNLPKKFFGDGFQDLAYPIWNAPQSGILVTPTLVSAGTTYASDVFCKPSVANGSLAVDVTVASAGDRPDVVEVGLEVVDSSGKTVKTFKPASGPIDAGKTVVVGLKEPWKDARLWWPDAPELYTLRTRISLGGEVLDVSDTPFGFREWSIRGKDFLLNGVPWHGWADTHNHPTAQEWLDFYHSSNQTFMRFWGTSWMSMPPDEALGFFDKSGVVVRRSGMLDGEAIGYNAIENDADVKKKENSEIKMDLMRNWRDQMVAQVKGERNHPSIMIWSIENEWLYINCINLYGGLMDEFEDEVVKTSDAVRAVDPTRPTMTDGGGAGKANKMPVHGDHYTAGPFPDYPRLAYTPNTKGGGRGRWEWDQKRPRFIGEELFAEGHNPKYSYFGGEEVFGGKATTRRAVGIAVRMMTEGARWEEYGAIHFWQSQNAAEGQYVANAPRAVFCRQWDWTFGSGETVKRTYRIFNDTHSDEPIEFTRVLSIGKDTKLSSPREDWRKTTTHRVPMGGSVEVEDTIPLEAVRFREEGALDLRLAVAGKSVFRDVKPVSILDTNPRLKPPAVRTPSDEGARPPSSVFAALRARDLAVYDPEGSSVGFLKEKGIPFTLFKDLKAVPGSFKILLIGKDAITPAESASTALAARALGGARVIVLEQKNPLKYQGVQPAEMEAAENEGQIAFIEDATHPLVNGLADKDFFTWSPGDVIYRDAYLKPTRGARSIVQCHELLKNTALVEIPVGEGLLVLSQLGVAGHLADNAVAQKLLLNLIERGAAYRLEFREVAAVIDRDSRLNGVLDALGLRYTKSSDPLSAMTLPNVKTVILSATPETLKTLAGNLERVEAFTDGGGTIVLHGLTPEGLEDYNTLVGFPHLIRPFRRERVLFPPVRDPLTAGLPLSDVALFSSERIFPWQEGNYVASDIFSHVIDYDDVAPFATFENEFNLNMVNGFVSADAWKYIVNVPAPVKPPLDFQLRFPKPQTITEVEWIGNTFYYPVTRFELLFDGKDAATFDVKPDNEPQTFAVAPSRTGQSITLRLADWEKVPGKAAVTGLDNIRLKKWRPQAFYDRVKPMINVGGLMHYPRGKGGIVLVNVLYKEAEDVPANAERKRAILGTILRNLQAPFTGGKTIIAGANLTYSAVDISKHANAYRTDRGWFGDAAFSFKDLPTGRQTFAGVPYLVYDFPTSPVPTVVMLGGDGVPGDLPSEVRGIPVDRKADALFFLQAARIDRRRNNDEIRDKKPFELARYVVHYADGKTADVPIYSEINVDDFKQSTPLPLPGASIAWTRKYADTDQTAVAYTQQWNNPRPDVPITSIDLVRGADPRGVPALIAVTAATGGK